MAAIPLEAHAAGANPSPSNPWITQNPGPAAFPVGPIAASNGARVALGRRTLVVSTDGKTWRETEIEARGIASGNGVFVAITKDQLMSSANGSDWKKPADAVGSTVAFGNGRFVVAGPSGVVVTSSDGLKWSHPSNRGAGDVALLVFWKGRFVAAIDGKKPHLVASQDGVHWSVVRRFESRSEQALLFGNGVFVHANDDGVFTSRDGLRWAAVGNAGMITAQRMFYAGDRFVGLITKDDRVSNLCASRDLESWTSLGPVLPLVRRMGFDDGRFYASDDDGVVYGSTDLTRWEAMNTASTQRLNAVACGNGWLVAVGEDGTVLRSQDATHWTAIDPITPSRLGAVTYWKGAFIAAGDPGVVLRSADGRDWTKVPLNRAPHLHALAYTDDVVVAVGSAPLFSSDGVVWKSGHGDDGQDLWQAAGGNGRIVAINEDAIATSADGSHWEKGIAPWSGHRSVQFHDGLFHIEDNDSVGLASVDGRWWKSVPTDVDDRSMLGAAVYTTVRIGSRSTTD